MESKFPGGLAELADKILVRSSTPDRLPLTRNAGVRIVPTVRQSRPDYAQIAVNAHDNVRNAVLINSRAGKLLTRRRWEILPGGMQAT